MIEGVGRFEVGRLSAIYTGGRRMVPSGRDLCRAQHERLDPFCGKRFGNIPGSGADSYILAFVGSFHFVSPGKERSELLPVPVGVNGGDSFNGALHASIESMSVTSRFRFFRRPKRPGIPYET